MSLVRIPLAPLWNLAISFATLCRCLLEETPKAVGLFNLVSMLVEVKDASQGTCNKSWT